MRISCIAAALLNRLTPQHYAYGHMRNIKGHAHVKFGGWAMRGWGDAAGEVTNYEIRKNYG